ncbi:MAG: DEAD/DEAH box helicase [Methylocella sp.]
MTAFFPRDREDVIDAGAPASDPGRIGATLRLTPHGELVFEDGGDAPDLDARIAPRLREAFEKGSGEGLWRLGAFEAGKALPPVFVWWRDFAARFVTALRRRPGELDEPVGDAMTARIEPPAPAELASLALTAPMMAGAEYLGPENLRGLWRALDAAFAHAFSAAGTDLRSFLAQCNPAWTLVGRVHFNLAENRRDPDFPFAFMATYTTGLSAAAKAQHLPLGEALRQYAGAKNKAELLSLLQPVQRAAEKCDWLKRMVDEGEIFHPLRWRPQEALAVIRTAPDLEAAGVILRMPPAWRAGRPPRPKATATIGRREPSVLGLDGLLDFRVEATLDGEPLTEEEVRSLLAGTDGLALLRGQWVEVDRARLEQAMTQFRDAESLAAREGVSFAEAMRLLAGAPLTEGETEDASAGWAEIAAGPWLAETLQALRAPGAAGGDPGTALKGALRPYQQAGVAWLRLVSGLGLGACLADDMGLGKTIQVLALLLFAKRRGGADAAARPSLLVAPASLLANWAGEIEKFAPSLAFAIVHPSVMKPEDLQHFSQDRAESLDLVITSYGSLLRIASLKDIAWRFVVLDEAQAIKNAAAKQTRAAKALKARARIALTGTPVENHLGDLWSIFDFLNPGLLGTARQFKRYAKNLAAREHNPYGPLRQLVAPYILRRMKTDRSIIADLPDKTEVKAHCQLSRKQAALYAQAVESLADDLDSADGIARKGLVLASLMRLKQICNHPSQWLGDQAWREEDSGKWARLRDIAEVIAARQQKMLVFTQFREVIDPLAHFLAGIFGRPGLTLHGETQVRKRKTLVRDFQEDEKVPFFVLSLKAGGSGLNLTAASHVVHFDRWWNPAVENQATDRAFRIGQKQNVLVHKFVCRGTVEEKIDALIESKRGLSNELLDGSAEISLTELGNDEILRLVALDLDAAMKE